MSRPPQASSLEVKDAYKEARALGAAHGIDRLARGYMTAADLACITIAARNWRHAAAAIADQGVSMPDAAAQRAADLAGILGPEPSDAANEATIAEAVQILQAREAQEKRVAALPLGYTVGELLKQDFPPPVWIVDGLLTVGLTLLVGAPKLGKSWMALALGAAVGIGGAVFGKYRVEQRAALYLALEDTPRRLKLRLLKIGASARSRLIIYTSWRSGAEGIADLDAFLVEHPDIKLILIDTLAKFRGTPTSEDRYAADYLAAGSIKAIADKNECAVVVVHHVRKMGSDDIMDTVSGTNGLNGAADCTWILSRSRGETDAKLFMTGRDIEEQTFALSFDPSIATWRILGNAEEYDMSKARRDILNVVRDSPMKPKALAAVLGKNESTTRNLLAKMIAAGTIGMDGEGNYHIPTIDSVVSVVTPLSTLPTVTTAYLPYADDSAPEEEPDL